MYFEGHQLSVEIFVNPENLQVTFEEVQNKQNDFDFKLTIEMFNASINFLNFIFLAWSAYQGKPVTGPER